MNLLVASAALLLALQGSTAPTSRKDCEELKKEIAEKLDAKGVKGYTLEIVTAADAQDAKDAKVVGSCDGGTKRIMYTRAQRP